MKSVRCISRKQNLHNLSFKLMKWTLAVNTHGLLVVFLVAQTIKNLPAMRETWVGKIPWRREWQPTPVFLPGEFHGQRSLVGYSPHSRKESDRTEPPTLSLSLFSRMQCWYITEMIFIYLTVFFF